jgi:hypothetical protein
MVRPRRPSAGPAGAGQTLLQRTVERGRRRARSGRDWNTLPEFDALRRWRLLNEKVTHSGRRDAEHAGCFVAGQAGNGDLEGDVPPLAACVVSEPGGLDLGGPGELDVRTDLI